jgi:hypothetical protein
MTAKTLILCRILQMGKFGRLWTVLIQNARDPRSVHLGLSTNSFKMYNTDSIPYSCWSVFIMPYHLPPIVCLKEGFTFLALVISGPKHPKKKINMLLHLLKEELKELLQPQRTTLFIRPGHALHDQHLQHC